MLIATHAPRSVRGPADRPRGPADDPPRRVRPGRPQASRPAIVQGNLAILPSALAVDFLRFCQLNPKPCPLLAASGPGDWRLPALAEDLDIRTDIPRYRVCGTASWSTSRPTCATCWRDDLVGFVLGCSFSFEEALIETASSCATSPAARVPMYRTTIDCRRPGPFHGPDGGFDAPAQSRRRDPRRSR